MNNNIIQLSKLIFLKNLKLPNCLSSFVLDAFNFQIFSFGENWGESLWIEGYD